MKQVPTFPASLFGSILGATIVPLHGDAPQRQHRYPPPVLPLRARVMAKPRLDHPGRGTVYAVVHSDPPVYDVKCDDGRYLEGLAAREVEALA